MSSNQAEGQAANWQGWVRGWQLSVHLISGPSAGRDSDTALLLNSYVHNL